MIFVESFVSIYLLPIFRATPGRSALFLVLFDGVSANGHSVPGLLGSES